MNVLLPILTVAHKLWKGLQPCHGSGPEAGGAPCQASVAPWLWPEVSVPCHMDLSMAAHGSWLPQSRKV